MFFSKKKKKSISKKTTAKSKKTTKKTDGKKEPVSKRNVRDYQTYRQSNTVPEQKENLDLAVNGFKKMMDDKRVKAYFKSKREN